MSNHAQAPGDAELSTSSLKSETRKDQILAMTVEIIANEGYPGFSMRNIARRLDIHLAAVQHYFPTKKDLLRATIAKSVESYNQEMEGLAHLPEKPLEWRLEAVANVMLTASMDPVSSGFFVALWALAAHDDEAAELLNDLNRRGCQRIASLIEQINPGLSQGECLDRAIAITSMLRGATIFIGPGRKFELRSKQIVAKLLVDTLAIARQS
jgi:AcrR family transcriptional regulator